MKKNPGIIVTIAFVTLAAVVGGAWNNIARGQFPFGARAEDSRRAATSGASHIRDVEADYREALQIVSTNHIADIDYERTNESAIQAMLWTLDPHSSFFTRDEYRRMLEQQRSSFYGIGVQILRHRDGVYVQSPLAGTPAARAGLRYGDRIVEVDGQNATEWTTEQVSQHVRGERGTSVILKVERAGGNAPLYFTIVRDSVPQPSIRDAFMMPDGVAYIGLTGGFTQTTDRELTDALTQLKRAGMRSVVLDLRNNPGGLLDKAIRVAGRFLPHGQTIVSVRSRNEEEARVYRNPVSDPENVPLVVLINRGSASASEIVSGAVQDYARGLVVGETSFGKGLVQRPFELPFGTALTLTTAKYFTPYGRSIQRDYSTGSLYDYYTQHTAGNGAPPADSSRSTSTPTHPDSPTDAPPPPRPVGSPVTTAAGRVFYGGGGITPDIEARPLDLLPPVRARIFDAAFYFTRELAAGRIGGLENYRVEQTQYDRAPRATDYPVTDRVIEAFREYVRNTREVGLAPAQIDANLDFARLRIRDEIITAAYGSTAGARVLLEADPQLLRAIQALPEARRLAEGTPTGATRS